MKKLAFALLLLAAGLPAQTSSTCRATLTADAQLIANEISAIAAQASAQGFPAAVQELARLLQSLAPTLTRPDQTLIDTFLTDLKAASASTGPGGITITASEKLKLTNDITSILLSTGLTNSDIAAILNHLQTALASLEGISTANLRAAIEKTAADAKACRVR